MYAVIKTGGKQLRVALNQEIYVEKLDAEVGSTFEFNEVLLVKNDDGLKVGTPVVENAKVLAKVIKHDKAKKITIFKYKAKKGSTRRKMGHRQPYTKLVVEAINL